MLMKPRSQKCLQTQRLLELRSLCGVCLNSFNRYLHVSQKVSLEGRDIPLSNTGNPASQFKPGEIFMTSTTCVRIRGGGAS